VLVVQLAEAVLPAMKQRLQQQSSELNFTAIETLAAQADNVAAGHPADWTGLSNTLPAAVATLLPADTTTIEEPADQSTDVAERPAEPTLKDLLIAELKEKLAVLTGLMERISRDPGSTANDDEIIAIHTIAGTTALDPLSRESAMAKALEGLLNAQRQSRLAFSSNAVWVIASSLAHFSNILAVHENDPEAELEVDEDRQIEQLIALTVEYGAAPTPQEEPAQEIEPAEIEPAFEEEPVVEEERVAEEEPVLEASEESTEPEEQTYEQEEQPAEAVSDPVDREILGIFLEEATDVLERCDSLLNTWRDNLSDLGIVQNLQREIHTFKGGARMAGISAMGDLSHSMETLLERIAGQVLPSTVPMIEILEQGCDRLNAWTQQASQGVIPQTGEVLRLFNQQVDALTAEPEQPVAKTEEPPKVDTVPEPIEEPAKTDIVPETIEEEAKTEEPAKIDTVPEELLEIPDVVVPPAAPEISEGLSADTSGSQHIRVNADLLDSLVNSAGEISIFRSHLEQQVGYMRENLKEFDDTVSRLREQFRKLEIETETQIGSRYQQEVPDDSDEFDPLELDRFSSLQHLTRSLSESVADLLNLQELLDSSARKSEALLVQQSRISNELQEGLMQTRMVHFGTIAPRLRRIIRTAAGETQKQARLHLRMTGGGDQLDRNVLERITAPLEHLLRNSIAHGIEEPAVRRELNKPEEGQLGITVSAEATEFVVRVEDDGAGINLKAIHQRAIEKGLMDQDSNPTPRQLKQLILNSGFSTSKTVTTLAGRGVGMDVVNNEIKQIGGSIEIESEEGKGCIFTIRIPFTLAVMQAIGVMAGEHPYLIPVASVAGVARMLPADYEEILQRDNPTYEFAGESYTILDLEPLLGEPTTPLGDDTISILMIKTGEQRAAFRVSALMGHKEIVVKPVGPQINSVPGILGGTITGDGQVVVIIDTGPLIRQALLTGARPAPPIASVDVGPQRTLALIADDSITMRKVNSRVLENYDIEVITARDGVEATEQMQDRVPDLLLLDIEMPRMDGYQVAEYVRADARLRNVPIIMITSRAGKKHRDRGKQAGANAYLSKPYKESELIAEVRKLLPMEMDFDD
jgi:chemosensory pili system protein ChpA (sensor histidine kinase/response regulator)